MDLFRDIKKGKFGSNPKLKHEAKHELKELGGAKKAEKYEKAIKRMKGKPQRSCSRCGSEKLGMHLSSGGVCHSCVNKGK